MVKGDKNVWFPSLAEKHKQENTCMLSFFYIAKYSLIKITLKPCPCLAIKGGTCIYSFHTCNSNLKHTLVLFSLIIFGQAK